MLKEATRIIEWLAYFDTACKQLRPHGPDVGYDQVQVLRRTRCREGNTFSEMTAQEDPGGVNCTTRY
jgi:hypothetical protein